MLPKSRHDAFKPPNSTSGKPGQHLVQITDFIPGSNLSIIIQDCTTKPDQDCTRLISDLKKLHTDQQLFDNVRLPDGTRMSFGTKINLPNRYYFTMILDLECSSCPISEVLANAAKLKDVIQGLVKGAELEWHMTSAVHTKLCELCIKLKMGCITCVNILTTPHLKQEKYDPSLGQAIMQMIMQPLSCFNEMD
jgi:hypothetical protein